MGSWGEFLDAYQAERGRQKGAGEFRGWSTAGVLLLAAVVFVIVLAVT